MEFRDIAQQRRSVKSYKPDRVITDDELRALFNLVVLSPSSFNLQHWRFVVVRDAKGKAALRKASWDQEQVEQASAVIIVAGKLNAHEDANQIFSDSPEQMRKQMVAMIHGFYADKPQMQRDEAIRSASLAAMSLMYAATDLGLASGPLIGFDPAQISRLINLPASFVPVVMIVLGEQADDMRPRATRLPVAEVVKLESFDGNGLS